MYILNSLTLFKQLDIRQTGEKRMKDDINRNTAVYIIGNVSNIELISKNGIAIHTSL